MNEQPEPRFTDDDVLRGIALVQAHVDDDVVAVEKLHSQDSEVTRVMLASLKPTYAESCQNSVSSFRASRHRSPPSYAWVDS
ncbi:hypothetical protein ACQEVG_37250 [Streptomyces sp. CA-135486]|uniref:hypothetical protein n=1 Tax=Streptomyces sp. CA-135486 TaxID=3240049 RepID=UPI003D8F3B83